MLDPRERAVLVEALRPPDGYELDTAIGTSYSLDLLALLTAPLAFTVFDYEDAAGHLTADPMALLESLRRYADRMLLFCQAGQIKIPPRNQPLLAHLEHCVAEVRAPSPAGVFHPKMWVLRFVAPAPPVRYRVLCLTRNLTFDRCWDTVLALDGEVVERRNAIAANKPLGDFLGALPDLAVRPLPAAERARVQQLAQEVRRIKFEVPDGFETVAFWPLGLPGISRWPFRGRIDRIAVVSPFLSDGLLDRLTRDAKGSILVSRGESLEAADPRALQNFERICVITDAAEPEASDEPPGVSEATSAPSSGLHAKLYVADAGWDASVWTGSANATSAAFNNNVEFLVELTGKKSLCGIDALLNGGGAKPAFADLLQDFAAGEPPGPRDPVARQLEELLDDTQRGLGVLGFTAVIQLAGEQFNLTFSSKTTLAVPAGVSVRCWPVTLREESALPVASGIVSLTFGALSLEALSAFFAFDVTATLDGQSDQRRFVVTAQLLGAPADRTERLLLSMLGDRARMLRFLLLLLAGSGLEARSILAGARNGAGGETPGPDPDAPHLFESLVQALERDPRKLDRIARLVEDLKATPAGISLIPDGFDAVWSPIWAARQALALPT